jgi:hypothetical protein
MQGDFDEARTLYSGARAIHEELGRRFRIVTVGALLAAEIEELAGQPAEAVSILTSAYETLGEMGAMSATATIAAFLADALSVNGRHAESVERSTFAQEHAPESDIVTQVLWRTARARALAENDPAAAEGLAREALAIARETDYVDLEGRALVCLAHAVGFGEEQTSLLGEAKGLYEAKGNVAAVARLPAPSPAPS